MPRQLELPAALHRRGLKVEVVPGWETRGSANFTPRGAISHWTAGPRTGDRPSLHICVNGRVDVPGPLCNVFLTRAGVAVVVAAGRANHGGRGAWRGYSGNSRFFGTEAECAGDGNWTAEQRLVYPLINAAYCDLGGFGPEMICSHHEYALPKGRKIDIRDWPISLMRQQVAEVLEGGLTMADITEILRRIDILQQGIQDLQWVEANGQRNTTDVVLAHMREAQIRAYPMLERLLNEINAKVDRLAVAGVDPRAVAEAVIERLGPEVASSVADELHRRLAP